MKLKFGSIYLDLNATLTGQMSIPQVSNRSGRRAVMKK